MSEFVYKYFKNIVEYPGDICNDILPMNTLWSYISTTFLNGFINYVEIKSAFVLNRYHDWNDNTELITISVLTEGKWVDFTGTKLEVYNRITEVGATYHVNLDNDFQDDVVILSKIDSNKWMFFWFDRDCSDSKIGRFETEESDEQVIKDFEEYCKDSCGIKYLKDETSRQIPLHYFQGWIKS